MSGRVNLIANTLTDGSTKVLVKGTSAAVHTLTVVEEAAFSGAVWMTGFRKGVQANEAHKEDERAFRRAQAAEALRLEMAEWEAAKAPTS